jgi:hypothetical protein
MPGTDPLTGRELRFRQTCKAHTNHGRFPSCNAARMLQPVRFPTPRTALTNCGRVTSGCALKMISCHLYCQEFYVQI